MAISSLKVTAMASIKTRPATYSALNFAAGVAGYELAYTLGVKKATTQKEKDKAFKTFCKAVNYEMKQLPFQD